MRFWDRREVVPSDGGAKRGGSGSNDLEKWQKRLGPGSSAATPEGLNSKRTAGP